MTRAALRRLLWPESVAVVGASPAGQWTRHMIPSMRRLGYRGEIFPVNPQYREVESLRCYPAVAEIPKAPDAVMIAVRRDAAMTAVEQCAARGAGGAVVLAGGFAEIGPEGAALQDRLRDVAGQAGMAILGPNCQGYINCVHPSALWMDEIFEPLRPGGIAIVSHSGTVATGIMNQLYRRGLYPSCVLSIGNEAVVTAAELIEACVDDAATRVIAAHLETIRAPERFFAACDRAAEAGKPVVVLKAGRSPAAQAAVIAHTAALAGPDRLIDAQLRRHRGVRAGSLDDLVETCAALSGRRIVSSGWTAFALSGGHIELVLDAAASGQVTFPAVPPAAAAKIRERLPAYLPRAVGNPIDTAGVPLEWLPEIVAAEPGIDGVMFVVQTRRRPTGVPDLLTATLATAEALHDTSDKPVIVLSANSDLEPSVADRLAPRGIPVLAGIEAGLRALEQAYRYHRPVPPLLADQGVDAAGLRRLAALRAPLAGRAALDLVAGAGVPVVHSIEAAGPDAAVAAADRLGYPVVVKTGAGDVLHRSEAGQVFVDLGTPEAVRRAAGAVRPPVLVQPCLAGVEFILGLESDPALGTCVLVGAGGVLAEVLDRVAVRGVPLRAGDAAEMLAELPMQRLLDGYRGRPPVDRAAVAAVIERVAAVGAAAGASLASLDLNPVIASPAGVYAVDALIVPRR
ncbi:MAG TPA: acetate--CoA ligase family protein [bacterium]|nr:acetate--CoA ligase family protein [bacterium]